MKKKKKKERPKFRLSPAFPLRQSIEGENTTGPLGELSLSVIILIFIFFSLCRGGKGEKIKAPLPHLSRSNRL
ncbi:hypothetical protein MRB53_008269 [Persea americana]|uniref:Uncharacterized protein n=1 Tax=Persea americana TaxID=3435 RepID=A0ACC2MM88_PERAE|nr:hypothetical protein MRB53_008269 [Persea americana]